MMPARGQRKSGLCSTLAAAPLRRALARFRLLARNVPGATVLEATTPGEIAHAVRHFQLKESDLLVILGGDGTLQAAISILLSREPSSLPTIAVIPGAPQT